MKLSDLEKVENLNNILNNRKEDLKKLKEENALYVSYTDKDGYEIGVPLIDEECNVIFNRMEKEIDNVKVELKSLGVEVDE